MAARLILFGLYLNVLALAGWYGLLALADLAARTFPHRNHPPDATTEERAQLQRPL